MSPLKISTSEVLNQYTIEQLLTWIPLLEQGKVPIRIPNLLGFMKTVPNMPYHHEPEVFLQISGITTFQFPEESFELFPGEIGIIPVGIPHSEHVRSYRKRPFLNLMFGFFYLDHLHFHIAQEMEGSRPKAFARSNILGFNVPYMTAHVGTAVERFHSNDPIRQNGAKAAILHLFYDFLHGIEHPLAARESTYRGQIEHILRTQLSNPNLSVEWIAEQLGLSPDHASRIYRKETGQYLAANISEKRLNLAKYLLEFSGMTIAEICHVAGYDNASYFSRAFRRATQKSPREFRAQNLRT